MPAFVDRSIESIAWERYDIVGFSVMFDQTLASLCLARAIKARWICEQAHQQLKEELGLDHFEGRSWIGLHRHALMARQPQGGAKAAPWIGLHRHALMAMMAYAFLQSRRLAQAGRKKKSPRAATSAQPASSSPGHP